MFRTVNNCLFALAKKYLILGIPKSKVLVGFPLNFNVTHCITANYMKISFVRSLKALVNNLTIIKSIICQLNHSLYSRTELNSQVLFIPIILRYSINPKNFTIFVFRYFRY